MIILVQKYGQLGNRLSYLKEFFAIALENNVDVVFFCFDEYAHYFSGTSRGLVCSFPGRGGRQRGKRFVSKCMYLFLTILGKLPGRTLFRGMIPSPDENGCHVFDEDLVGLVKQRKIALFRAGWPCVSDAIIDKHSDKIREYFSLVAEHASRVSGFISEIKRHGDLLVGIHMRMGDYRYWHNGKFFFDVDEYLILLREIVVKHKDKSVVFIICTNEDQEWSRFDEFTYFAGLGDTIGDLYSLAACDEIYGPQSSYSAWASFYGKVPFYEMCASK